MTSLPKYFIANVKDFYQGKTTRSYQGTVCKLCSVHKLHLKQKIKKIQTFSCQSSKGIPVWKYLHQVHPQEFMKFERIYKTISSWKYWEALLMFLIISCLGLMKLSILLPRAQGLTTSTFQILKLNLLKISLILCWKTKKMLT